MDDEDYGEILENLKRLQHQKLEVIRLRQGIEQVPQTISALERDTREKEEAVSTAEEEVAEERKRNLSLEAELQSMQAQLSHSNEQILKVKTNEQLWALQKEIEYAKGKISTLETKIIESMEDLDNRTEKLSQSRKDLESSSKDNARSIENERRKLEQMEEELERVSDSESEIRAAIPTRYAELFDRIIEAKKDFALALVLDGSCKVCHVRVRPQTLLEIRSGRGLHQCDSCRRILYFEEEPPLENPAELSS